MSDSTILDKKNKIVIIIVTIITITLLASGLGYQKFDKLSKIKNFNVYVTECSNNVSQCELGEEEEVYNDIIVKSKQAISDENINKIEELQPKLKEIQQRIANKNKEAINSTFEKIKNADISVLNQDRKSELNNKITEIEGLIKDIQFKTASNEIEALKKKESELILDQKLDNIDDLIQNDKRSEARKSIRTLENESLNKEQMDTLDIYKNKAAMTKKEACIIGITKVFGEYKYVTQVKIGSSQYTMNTNGQINTWHGGVAQLDTTDEPEQFLFSTKPFDKEEVASAEKIFDKEHSSWMIVYPTKEQDGSYKISGRFYSVVITPANGGDIVFDGSKGFHNGYISVNANEEIYIDGTVNRYLDN